MVDKQKSKLHFSNDPNKDSIDHDSFHATIKMDLWSDLVLRFAVRETTGWSYASVILIYVALCNFMRRERVSIGPPHSTIHASADRPQSRKIHS